MEGERGTGDDVRPRLAEKFDRFALPRGWRSGFFDLNWLRPIHFLCNVPNLSKLSANIRLFDGEPRMNKGGKPQDVFDVERIRQIIELMEQHDLSEVDLQEGDEKMRLKRGGSAPLYAAPPCRLTRRPGPSREGRGCGGRHGWRSWHHHHQRADGGHLLFQGESRVSSLRQGW